MKQIRWTEQAAADLESITDYLFENAPERALEIVNAIYNAPSILKQFPYVGRPGKRKDTRELVLAPLPYIIVYTLPGDVIYIARILHGAEVR